MAGPKRVLSVTRETQPYRTELTPVSFLRRTAYVFPDKLAIVHGARHYTYRQFEERVNRLANGLRALGLRHLDRVAAILPNTPAMLDIHYGVPAAGLVPNFGSVVLGVGGFVRVLRALGVALAVVGLLRLGLTLVVFGRLLAGLLAGGRRRGVQAVDDDPSGQEGEDRQAGDQDRPGQADAAEEVPHHVTNSQRLCSTDGSSETGSFLIDA